MLGFVKLLLLGMDKKRVIIFGVIFVVFIIFFLWLNNFARFIKSPHQSDKFGQILEKNFTEIENIFKDFKQGISRFSNSRQESLTNEEANEDILTNEELERLKNKIYEAEKGATN